MFAQRVKKQTMVEKSSKSRHKAGEEKKALWHRLEDLAVHLGIAKALVLPTLLIWWLPLPYALALKVYRIIRHPTEFSWLQGFQLLWSDFCFQLAMVYLLLLHYLKTITSSSC